MTATPLQPDRKNLAARFGQGADARWLSDRHETVSLAMIASTSLLGGRVAEFKGRNVALVAKTQLQTARLLAELDGLAAGILLVPPDLAVEHFASVVADAKIDAVVAEDVEPWKNLGLAIAVQPSPAQAAPALDRKADTHWLMLTSGTTGRPKIVAHTLDALTGTIAPVSGPLVWATFYDIRRYGGLQILLRAFVGGGSLVLSDKDEAIVDFIKRCALKGVNHISGTPSHWRKAMMSEALAGFDPPNVRLSGEIADQAVLDALRKQFPKASIVHAYASTEAGVGFAVTDGLAGFPENFISETGPAAMKIVDGVLHIRSNRAALSYVGEAAPELAAADGYVDTGDMVELRDGRYHFTGRRGGIMNIGGLKVHPEEVENALNAHPAVRMSRARARKSPIMGAIVVADIVLRDEALPLVPDLIKGEILTSCRKTLAPHKVPVSLIIVPSIEVSANGKLVRNG